MTIVNQTFSIKERRQAIKDDAIKKTTRERLDIIEEILEVLIHHAEGLVGIDGIRPRLEILLKGGI